MIFRNWREMPSSLKIATATCFAGAGVLCGSLVSKEDIIVYGHHIANSIWWSSGAGVVLFVPATLGVVSGIFMARRSSVGRWLFILYVVASMASIGLVARLLRLPIADKALWLGIDMAAAIAVATYLYRSPSIRRDFAGSGAGSRSDGV